MEGKGQKRGNVVRPRLVPARKVLLHLKAIFKNDNVSTFSLRTEEGKAVAFSHFRFDMDYDDEVSPDSVQP